MLTARIEKPQIQCGITRTTDGDARDHPRQRASLADVFRADREPRPALLPVDRGQDRPLRRARRPSDFPRAGRPRRHDRLSERHLDLAAGGRAARAGRDDSRAGKGAHRRGPATRSNTITSIRASSTATLETQAACAGCSSPARSTARPATRRRRRRALSPASTPRARAGGGGRDRVRSRRRLSRRDDRRPGDARRHRAVSHVHLARRISADAARRQCRPAPDRKGHRARLRRAASGATASTRRRSRSTTRARLARVAVAHAEARPSATASRSTRTASAAPRSSCCPIRTSDLRDVVADLAAARRDSPPTIAAAARDRRQVRGLSRPPGGRRRGLRRDEALELPDDLDYAADARPLERSAAEARQRSARAPSARPAASTASRRRR